MILSKALDKLNTRFILGYDLGNTYSQISFSTLNQEEPETLAAVTGSEQYSIPTVLCKRTGVNQWFYGTEAIRNAESGNGILIDRLLERAQRNEMMDMEGMEYSAITLLSLFVKRTLSIFSLMAPVDRIETAVFTSENLDREMIDIMERITGDLALKCKRIFFQSHRESFYYYILHQSADLRSTSGVLLDYRENGMISYFLDWNRRTTPVVALMEEQKWSIQDEPEEEEFRNILECVLEGKKISSVHLVGEHFEGKWLDASLPYLCAGRRVFRGNNLYSKGAVYAGMEKTCPTEVGKGHVFLGKDKLKSNIGMQVWKEGKEQYQAILDAGQNWYDTKASCQFYLEEDEQICLIITPLYPSIVDEGMENYPIRKEWITLDGFPERPEGCSRIEMSVDMTERDTVRVKVEDMGFGEIFPGTHRIWEKEIKV